MLWTIQWEIARFPWKSIHTRRRFSTKSTDFPTKSTWISVSHSTHSPIRLLESVGKGDFPPTRRMPLIHRSHRFRHLITAVENEKFCIVAGIPANSARFRAPIKRSLWKSRAKSPLCGRFSQIPPCGQPMDFLPRRCQTSAILPKHTPCVQQYPVIPERISTFPPFCRPYDCFGYELTYISLYIRRITAARFCFLREKPGVSQRSPGTPAAC